MIYEILIAVFSILTFILLFYSVLVLFRRREYESNRILNGYNVLILGLLILGLMFLVRGIEYIFLIVGGGSSVYFGVVSTLILLPLAAIAFLVSMFLFRSV